MNQGNNIAVPVSIVVAGLVISAGLFFGLQKSGNILGQNNVPQDNTATDTPIPTPTEAPAIVSISVDDDPVLGDANAPVTMIEFSDYECPYCKRNFEDTFPQIVENYIDTGMVKYVFRDLPLYFHDPAATKEANIANCAREQGGDEMYYKMHDALYTATGSNGAGFTDAVLDDIVNDLGLDGDALKTCYEEERYATEITSDANDAAAVGANGTPTFFIGASDPSGTIQGERVVGALPYASVKAVIDSYLN
ncbi:DsbA family protein [candidate division WWE3 bacterium]|uniref:DsbA family protein n=1 Tax=candidate division WWE3 bacterium TaxID=2053526 RepID=A0A955LLW0_UNCKA|nr:DsbA family protein [candidate division WWE3 bacterium]